MANPFRLPAAFFNSLGFSRGVFRDWHYVAEDEEALGEIADKALVLLGGIPENTRSGCVRRAEKTEDGGTLLMRVNRCGKRFMGLFCPLYYLPHIRSFDGGLIMLKEGLPTVRPVAFLERGGGLRPLDTVVAFRLPPGFLPLPEFLASLTRVPDPLCSAAWRGMGAALGSIHAHGYVAGITEPAQVFVRLLKKGGVEVALEAGGEFDVRPVLRRAREYADMAAANFVFDPRIAPLDRLRFFDAYREARGMDKKEMREFIEGVSEAVRLRAMKEWKIYPTDIPKKTTFLNLIRALDKHSEQTGE